jgi:hypothetical protein
MELKTATTLGSFAGLAAFVAVGLLPSLAYGGYAGHLLAGGIGGPLAVSRLLVLFGMGLGIVGVGSLFAVIGAMVGTAVGSALRVRHAQEVR